MNLIPLQAIPAQSFQIAIYGQQVQMSIYQKGSDLYADITSNDVPVRQCRKVLNGVRLVRYAYLGFVGDLAVYDTRGNDDPAWGELGSRYQLVYLSPADLASMGYDA